jgi:hypothetical protein
LEGNNFYGYVTGDLPCPPKFLQSTSIAIRVENPAYTPWYQQDKLIMSAAISSLSVEIVANVVVLRTSREVWVALEKMFASQSKACVMQTRYQLATLKTGALSISDYFQKAKTLAQSLAAIGEPLKDSKLVSYILASLGLDYDSLVTTVTTRIEPIFLDDLYGYLLTHEQRLEHVHSVNEITVSIANVAQRNTPISGRNQPHKHFSNTSNQSYGRGRGQGHGRFSASTSNHPIYQICNKIGHIAS